MAWYMAFPVVMFWIFNRPSFYEKIMYETKVSKIMLFIYRQKLKTIISNTGKIVFTKLVIQSKKYFI